MTKVLPEVSIENKHDLIKLVDKRNEFRFLTKIIRTSVVGLVDIIISGHYLQSALWEALILANKLAKKL